jgi:hypothetical protein
MTDQAVRIFKLFRVSPLSPAFPMSFYYQKTANETRRCEKCANHRNIKPNLQKGTPIYNKLILYYISAMRHAVA